MGFTIRPYPPADPPDLYEIRLLTGDGGVDASQLDRDRVLLSHFYAAP